jgi:hypothetical protein
MALNETERNKVWEALNGGKPLSMLEADKIEKKMHVSDRKDFHGLIYGKIQKSPKYVYEMLEKNTKYSKKRKLTTSEIVKKLNDFEEEMDLNERSNPAKIAKIEKEYVNFRKEYAKGQISNFVYGTENGDNIIYDIYSRRWRIQKRSRM